MKYRLINSEVDESFDIITENGGVVSHHHNGVNWVSTYYQCKLIDFSSEEYVWDKLSEEKVYLTDWEVEPSKDEMIKYSLEWLVYPTPDNWEIDDELFLDYFPK